MPSDKRPAALLIVWVLSVAGVAATPGLAVGESLLAAAPQDPSAGEASLELQRPVRRLIQQGLRNEGFDPGTPDGLFGPRTRAAIREWQQSRGASPTGYLNGAEAELLRTAAAPPPAVPETSPPLDAVAAVDPSASSAAAAPASTPAEAETSPASPATVAVEEVDPQDAPQTNTQQRPRAPPADGTVQLPPEILVDRHLVRAERLLASGDPDAALEAMNEILALQEEHDLVLQDGFDFEYAQVAYAAGRTETAIASANQYLASAGREGEFYREALELLDSAEVRIEREAAERRRTEAERRRAEAQRQRADRWPPGHVFRDCETCPEMVVLPGSAVALGRYEVTVGEYRAFASATSGGQTSPCENIFSDRVSPDLDGLWDHSWRDPGFPQTDRHPITCMSWDDARAYMSWLRETTGAGYGLPTYEELREVTVSPPGCDISAGTTFAGPLGTCGCHSRGTGEVPPGTCPVGTYGRNRFGLSDMLGNVAEWTSRCRGDCGRRLVHGGRWVDTHPSNFHSSAAPTDYRSALYGFRVARTLE